MEKEPDFNKTLKRLMSAPPKEQKDMKKGRKPEPAASPAKTKRNAQ